MAQILADQYTKIRQRDLQKYTDQLG
jgi:hypothetical protein